MKFVFIAVISITVLMIFFCRNYGKDLSKSLNKKQHPLRCLYGFSMFLLDKFFWRFIRRSGKTSDKLCRLTVGSNSERILYIYSLKKMSVSLLVLLTAMSVGLCICISNESAQKTVITLERPEAEEETRVNLKADTGEDEIEDINITLSGRDYTDSEVMELLESKYDELIETMLGDNESLDYIIYDLNFVTTIGDDINVTWDLSECELVSSSGKLSEDIDPDGEIVEIGVELSYEEQKVSYTLAMQLFPVPETEKTLEEKVQEIVDAQSDNEESTVTLPDEIDGVRISFSDTEKVSTFGILLFAIILSIGFFILKDRELDSQIEKRNVQMMKDYPEIVWKLQLLTGAGITVSRAWERIVTDYEDETKSERKSKNNKEKRYAYEEMKLALNRMKGGISDVQSYSEFGSRCRLHSYMKLGSLLEQNVKRGTKGIDKMLENEVKNAFEERKNLAKKLGEEAGTKLLVPMVIMLVITIVIIMVPALVSINV